MFRAHALIIRRSKLHYTASGIITPIGGRLMHETATYRCSVPFSVNLAEPADLNDVRFVDLENFFTLKQKPNLCDSKNHSYSNRFLNLYLYIFIVFISMSVRLQSHRIDKSWKIPRHCEQNWFTDIRKTLPYLFAQQHNSFRPCISSPSQATFSTHRRCIPCWRQRLYLT